MARQFTILDPNLLCSEARKQPLQVFLCGPGVGNPNYYIREKIRSFLTEHANIKVVYGEEIEQEKFIRKGVDLQTLEANFAHSVDFTILMLDSPGSIAELGTFSMIPNLRSRLFVVLSSKFYRVESYIARGPLSLIAMENKNQIVYFDHANEDSIKESILLPVLMYKYARNYSFSYVYEALNGHRRKERSQTYYADSFHPIREKFFDSLILLAINVLGTPTFTEVISGLRIDPEIVNESLSHLFKSKKIQSGPGGRYIPTHPFTDSILTQFSTTAISQLRAKRLSMS